MTDPSETDSPASKAFASSLAKYAYSPTTTSPAHPPRPTRIPRPNPSPLRPTKREAISDSSSELSSESEVGRATPSKRKAARPNKFGKGGEAGEVEDPKIAKGPKNATTPKNTKNGKKPRPFAAPEVYAHLPPVGDLLKADLDGMSHLPLTLFQDTCLDKRTDGIQWCSAGSSGLFPLYPRGRVRS